MQYNTATPKDIKRAEKAARQAERDAAAVVVNIASTVEGRRWLWEELTRAHIFSTSFSSDVAQMAFLEGERNRGLQLFGQIIQHCPEQFTQAMREANERANTSTVRDPSAEPDADGDEDSNAGE